MMGDVGGLGGSWPGSEQGAFMRAEEDDLFGAAGSFRSAASTAAPSLHSMSASIQSSSNLNSSNDDSASSNADGNADGYVDADTDQYDGFDLGGIESFNDDGMDGGMDDGIDGGMDGGMDDVLGGDLQTALNQIVAPPPVVHGSALDIVGCTPLQTDALAYPVRVSQSLDL